MTSTHQRRARREPKQMGFDYRTWGGKRRGSGRKPKGTKAGVSHRTRDVGSAGEPVLVTMRMVDGLRGLRGKVFERVRECLRDAVRADFRVVHFTVMGNHLHLVVEAEDRRALAKGMQGLAIRVARAVNGHLGR